MRRELRGRELRGFVGGSPQSGENRAPRPDPDDAFLSRSASVGGPGKNFYQVEKALPQESSPQKWGLVNEVAAALFLDTKFEMPAPQICLRLRCIHPSEARVLPRPHSDQTVAPPEGCPPNRPPTNLAVEPLTRRMRKDLPPEVGAMAKGRSALSLED